MGCTISGGEYRVAQPRSRGVRALPALLLLLLLPPPVPTFGEGFSEKQRRAAIRRGFAYLDGHLFQLPESSGTPRKPFTYAVAGLCYLMRNETATSKKSGAVERIRKYLVRYIQDLDGRLEDPANLPHAHGVADSRRLIQYTWPLAVAGFFFLELDLRGRRSGKELRLILGILAAAQQENGGWGHGLINAKNDPGRLPGMPGSYPNTLLSSSNCVAMTVGLAQARGLQVGDAFSRAQAYYRAARLDNGSFPYDPSQRSSGFAKTNVGRTAGSIFAMHCLKMPRDEAFSGSVDYLRRNFEFIPEGHGSPSLNMLHGALACQMLGRRTWSRFQQAFYPRLIRAQDDRGHLACICEQKAFGVTCDTNGMFRGLGGVFRDARRCYTTALHTFVLLLEGDRLRLTKLRKPGASITPKRKRRR